MNIGIDVDGTLMDISSYMLETGRRYFHREPDDPAAFDVDAMFSCTHKERTRFWMRHLLRYCTAMPAIDGAAETIRRLREDGHSIYIVTSRVYTTRSDLIGILFRSLLIRWLKKNGIAYDDIVFCEDTGESKLRECQRLHVDVMLDDKPDNLITISRACRVIVCPMPWNREMAEQGFVRARDWDHIYDLLSADTRA